MKLSLYRDAATALSTEGKLFVDGVFSCFTLELPIKDGLPGSAIPAGTYPIELAPSPKFLSNPDPFFQPYAARMPHIVDIPGRSLIMIHPGNLPSETNGCVLVGQSLGANADYGSRAAFVPLYMKIAAAVPDVSITIFDPPATPPADPTASAWPNS